MKIVDPQIKQPDEFAGEIIHIIAHYYNMSSQRIYRRDKRAVVSEARTFCYHFIRLYTRLTFKTIGYILDRDHSTVLLGDKKLRIYMDMKDRFVFSKYLEIKYNIDEAVRKKYPRTFGLRISTFVKSETLTV